MREYDTRDTTFMYPRLSHMLLNIVQIITAVLLITTILMQQRGSGLSSAFGGGGGAYYQKRGMEKILFRATVALSALFLSLAFLNLVI